MDLKKLIAQMTMQEKIGQLSQCNANLFINTDADVTGPLMRSGLTAEDLKTVGSILNFKNAEEVIEIQNRHLAEDRNKIPMMFMIDVIHGYKTIYPIPLALGCSFDTEIVEECTRMASKEAAAAGVHVTFTPMVDYVRDARWGRVMESCGEEPLLNAIMGVAQIKAFKGDSLANPDSLATCVKHFAAYGGAEAGRDYNTVELSEHVLREYYLPAYKACLDAGADMLMPGFNTLNGVPAVANSWLMKKILKDEWHADPLVISDFGAIGELTRHGVALNLKEAARLAFDNGCHIEMCSSSYINHLSELIDEGVFSEEQLDAAVLKVLELKEKLGLFEDPYHGASPEKEAAVCLTAEHRDIARRAAVKSAVLLKNEGVLPFSKTVKKVALIGPFADNKAIKGFWACGGSDNDCISVKQGVENILPDAEIVCVKGCGNYFGDNDRSGIADAVNAAKSADIVILCLGEPQEYSGEGNCRADIDLPGVQNELAERVIAANGNTAVLLFTGRPLAIAKLDEIAPAILNMWFPGTEGGNAAAALLFGYENPSGKLDMSFPASTGQCPVYYNRLNTGRPKPMDHDKELVLYCSGYLDCRNLPLYPFGHGLSYSNIVYEALALSQKDFSKDEQVRVSVTVYNDSDLACEETVMLYMHDVTASNARPVQQLIAFEKISLAQGERRVVEFTVTEPMLRFWNNENEYVSEHGIFRISTGYADHLIHTKELYLMP